MNYDEAPSTCPACENTFCPQVLWCGTLNAWLCSNCIQSWSNWEARSSKTDDALRPWAVQQIDEYAAKANGKIYDETAGGWV